MTTAIQELEVEVLGLGPSDRARLLERLLESFEPNATVQDAWLEEALRRKTEVATGKVTLVSSTEAVACIRAKIA